MKNSRQATRPPTLELPSKVARFFLEIFKSLERLFRRPAEKSHLIEHVIVLMLENRSFDHMLGHLPDVGGLTGDEFNLLDPSDPNSERVCVNNQAGHITRIDPSHEFLSVHEQLFGDLGIVVDPAPMNGFVKACIKQAKGDVEIGKAVMACFNCDNLPTLRTLAQEFCLCTRWFSSIPGPTWPNRFFVHAATSDGMVTNDARHIYDMKTIYNSLAANGLSWNIYFGDMPHSLALERLWANPDHFRRFERFRHDVDKGELANYTFIEPRYFDFFEWKANDQHPPHDVRFGEYLIAEIYDTLRRSKFWEKSLFIVLYDEHGGFFDQVPPPSSVTNPDGQNCADPSFDFTRLGVRVPAVLVSPLVERGQVDSTNYEHSSIPATIKKLFDLPAYLTARDKTAHTFDKNLSRSTPRTDTPLTLPVPGEPEEIQYHRELIRSSPIKADVRGEVGLREVSTEPLSEFQETLVELANRLDDGFQAQVLEPAQLQTEHEAAVYVQERLTRFLER